jgi:hypothetical protein
MHSSRTTRRKANFGSALSVQKWEIASQRLQAFPSTYYAGAASGGVWKSIDGGNRWTPVFDKQPAAAIGSLAVSPSDPSVV